MIETQTLLAMLEKAMEHLDDATATAPPSRKAILAAYAELQRARLALKEPD